MRNEILKQLGARFFDRVEAYDGVGCLRTWEVGPLVITRFVEW